MCDFVKWFFCQDFSKVHFKKYLKASLLFCCPENPGNNQRLTKNSVRLSGCMWDSKKIFVVFVVSYFIHRMKEGVCSVPLEVASLTCGGGVKERECRVAPRDMLSVLPPREVTEVKHFSSLFYPVL